jgi:hypothetical protein
VNSVKLSTLAETDEFLRKYIDNEVGSNKYN